MQKTSQKNQIPKNFKKLNRASQKLTDKKIKQLLDFKHLHELFFLTSILSADHVKKFIKHYKDSDIKVSKEKRLDEIIKKSDNKSDLISFLTTELIKDLEIDFRRITKKVGTHLKKGNDVYIANLKLTLIGPKIELFKNTGSREDYYKVKKIFHDVERDIDEIIHNEEMNENKMSKIDKEIKDIKEELSSIE